MRRVLALGALVGCRVVSSDPSGDDPPTTLLEPGGDWYGAAPPTGCAAPGCPAETPVQLTIGRMHTCARMQDGGVRCWGDDTKGQLGGSSRQASIAGLPRTIDVAAGLDHTCAVSHDARVFCWGGNEHGQLGDDQGAKSAAPVEISLPPGAAPVRVFGFHDGACVQRADNALSCWGQSGLDPLAGWLDALAFPPGDAGRLVDLRALVYYATTAILRFADGHVESRYRDVAAPGAPFDARRVGSVAAGAGALAVDEAGQLWGFGRDNAALHGKYCRNNGCPIAQVRPANTTPSDTAHACFCAASPTACADGNCPGSAECAFFNDAEPYLCSRAEYWSPDLWLPNELTPCSTTRTFTNGSFDRAANIAGAYTAGPAEYATYDDSSQQACIRYEGPSSSCAMVGAGDATGCRAEGSALFAELGVRWVQVGVSRFDPRNPAYACLLDEHGFVSCWGHNNVGQLGQGHVYPPQGGEFSRPALLPLRIEGPRDVVELVVGSSHACARTARAEVYCWGENYPAFPSSRVGQPDAPNGAVPRAPLSFSIAEEAP